MKRLFWFWVIWWSVMVAGAIWALSLAIPSNAQANNPFSPDATPVQGSGPTGNEGWPIATVPATGALPWPVNIMAFMANLIVNQGTSPWVVGFDGTSQPVNVTGGTMGLTNGVHSTVNTSIVPLAASGVYTGSFEDVTNYSTLECWVFVLPTSAGSNGARVRLEWSFDGVTVDFSDSWQVFGSVQSGTTLGTNARVFEWPIKSRFVRYVYTNGTTAQTTFHTGLTYRLVPKNASLNHGFVKTGTLDSVTSAQVFSGYWEPFAVNGQSVWANSASRTATTTFTQFTNTNNRVGIFGLRVTAVPAVPGTGGLDLSLRAIDASGTAIVVNAPLPSTSRVRTVGTYRWYFGLGASSINLAPGILQVVNYPLPFKWQVQIIHHDAQAYTYAGNVEILQ